MSKTGRNDPCPCGSGRKYKQCHGAAAANEAPPPEGHRDAVGKALRWLQDRHRKAMEAALVEELEAIWPTADEDDLPSTPADLHEDDGPALQARLVERWLAEGEIHVRGAWIDVVDLLLSTNGPRLTPPERHWLQALARAPLRLYTVTDVQVGEGFTLVDAQDSSLPPRRVQERSGSRQAEVGQTLGLRIVDLGDHLELSGAVYEFSRGWAQVAQDSVRELASRTMDPDDQRALIGDAIGTAWLEQMLRGPIMPTLVDASTGEPLLHITDHYEVGDTATLSALLNALPELTNEDVTNEDGGERTFTWSRLLRGEDGADRPQLTLRLRPERNRAEVFYRTQALADSGRPWIEARAGEQMRHLTREVSDPRHALVNNEPEADQFDEPGQGASKRSDASFSPTQMHELMRETLHRFYAKWSDEPIPMLDNQTPRQALATPAGEERVRGLLRMYEQGEAEQARAQGREAVSYDFLWAQIGLQRDAQR